MTGDYLFRILYDLEANKAIAGFKQYYWDLQNTEGGGTP